jgi:hypothetical protein
LLAAALRTQVAMPGFCKPKEKQTLEEEFLQSSLSHVIMEKKKSVPLEI